MERKEGETIRAAVRERYALIAREGRDSGCCGGESSGGSACCGAPAARSPAEVASALGYHVGELHSAPEEANLGLGCGNPQAIASLKPGETVLDLGSGGGFDCFLAARSVGETGFVVGVDMTADMVALARDNAAKAGRGNVEFRLGEIERLPVADSSIDVIISNCVINLSPDKPQVFREAFRVLKTGGRLAISDVVAFAPIPERLKADLDSYASCVAGAASVDELRDILAEAGFVDIRIRPKRESAAFIRDWSKTESLEDFVTSATIEAVKN